MRRAWTALDVAAPRRVVAMARARLPKLTEEALPFRFGGPGAAEDFQQNGDDS